MSENRVLANVYSPTRLTSDSGAWLPARGTRDGAQFTSDWLQALVMEGRAYTVTVGALSTPIVGGGAGTVLDLDQPEFIISVPDGTCILPFSVKIQCQVPLLAADSEEAEILLAVDRAAAAVDDGTKTAETIFNLRTDNPRSSNCTATSAYTADVTDPVLGIELARAQLLGDFQGTPANAMWTPLALDYQPRPVPIIMGPGMLIGYWGGTVAASGFAQVSWIELPENAFA